MSTDTEMPDIEARLRAALTARADQVRIEDLAPLTPIVELRPRWQSPWVLLATAATVLLVLGLVVQGVGGRERADQLAPEPDRSGPQLEIPADVGRDWTPGAESTPARLDLDGDGVKERVEFLAEPTETYASRIRLQTTLSSTGDEAYGLAQLGTTIGTHALEPVDADADGDQELLLYREDLAGGPGAPVTPLVFDLRDGLLVEAPPVAPDLLLAGDVAVPGSATTYFDLVHHYSYWIQDGRLFSSRSRSTFARGGMTLLRPETFLADTYEWTLGEEGLLHPTDAGCTAVVPEARADCGPGQVDDPPLVAPRATETVGVGEQAEFDEGYAFSARIESTSDPRVVVEGSDGRTLTAGLAVADPRISTVQPTSVFYDGASVVVTSDADPTYVQVLVQDGDGLRAMDPVGEIALANEGPVRTWLTQNGVLVSVVRQEDGTWQAWQWVAVRPGRMAAFPDGTVCFADVDAGLTTPC